MISRTEKNMKISKKDFNELLSQLEKESKVIGKLRALYELNKKNPKKANDNLIKLMFDKELIITAYGNLQTNSGALSQGVDPNDTVDGFNSDLIDRISNDLREGIYKWKNIKKVEILKPGKKNKNRKRLLGLPTFSDKIVQEMIRIILSVIYEPTFQILEVSHGSRPKRGTQTAIKRLKDLGQGMNYAIEGDIKGAFPNMDHDVLMNVLKKRISDKKFLELIENSLKIYVEFKGRKELSEVGSPQGSIASPILFNIYMNELDKKIQEIVDRKEKDNEREERKIYMRSKRMVAITARIYRNRNLLEEVAKKTPFDAQKFSRLRDQVRKDKKLQLKISPRNWSKYVKRMTYCRYVDDWILLINERESEAISLKAEITKWIKENLKLELDQEKTHITNLNKGKAKFLGFTLFNHIKRVQKKRLREDRKEHSQRAGTLLFIGMDHEWIKKRMVNLQILDEKHRTRHVEIYCSLRPWQIVTKFKQKIEGFADYYYSNINYKSDLGVYYYYMYYSCLKTISFRMRISVSQIIKRYGPEIKIPGAIKQKNELGIETEKDVIPKKFPKYLDLMDRIGNRTVINRANKKCELINLRDIFKGPNMRDEPM